MIRVEDLRFTYPGAAAETLHGLSFDVRRGEVFGLLGPSGAGKSTTQRILVGLQRRYQGRVESLGRPLETWGADYFERVGVSFELPNHYLKLTALENLRYFRSLYSGATEEPMALLEQVGLSADANQRVGQFSKGMKNRLTLARALLHKPDLLFLDEPTSGLDPVSSRFVRDLVKRKRDQGTTIVITTHDMDAATELCDRVAFIIDGAIRLIDSPRELKLRHGRSVVRVEYREDGSVAAREFPLEGAGKDPEFVRLLAERQVETVHSQEATLESVFIQVTGRSLA
jgi:fluoroquinolone transport system ATP-binding protein